MKRIILIGICVLLLTIVLQIGSTFIVLKVSTTTSTNAISSWTMTIKTTTSATESTTTVRSAPVQLSSTNSTTGKAWHDVEVWTFFVNAIAYRNPFLLVKPDDDDDGSKHPDKDDFKRMSDILRKRFRKLKRRLHLLKYHLRFFFCDLAELSSEIAHRLRHHKKTK